MVNVLLLYDVFIPSVRLCAYEQLKYLHSKQMINFASRNAKEVTPNELNDSDVIFLVRSSTYLESMLARKLKDANKYLVYVLDDDLLEIYEGSNTSRYFNSSIIKERILTIMGYCDALLSPSKRLLNKYGNKFNKSIYIDEPAFQCCSEKGFIQDDVIRIGFAGSIDRTSDIDELLYDAILFIQKKYKDKVQFEFMGAKPKIVDTLNLKHYPYEDDYDKYKEVMSNLHWHIGLAPMPNTDFHKSKYFNKYIEYGSYNIVGIYTNMEPYNNVIKDNYNGILCSNTTDDWIEKISWCIENISEVEKISKNVYADIKTHYSIETISKELLNQLRELLSHEANNKVKCNLYLIKAFSYVVRVYEYLLRTPPKEIIKKVFSLLKRRQNNE